MPVFQVVSRTVKSSEAPKNRLSYARRRWYAVLRVTCGFLLAGTLMGLSRMLDLSLWFFVLLPVGVSIITARPRPYKRNALMLTVFLALIYFGGITALQLLIHSPSTPEIIVVTTTLFMAVLFEPVRMEIQFFIEQRFHLYDEASKALTEFTSTLSEQIDLDQVRERLLDVVQKAMQPQFVSIWVLATRQIEMQGPGAQTSREKSEWPMQHSDDGTQKPAEVTVANSDPFVAYALQHTGVVEVERLLFDSPILETLRGNGVEIALPLVSQRELLGLLNLGPRLNEQEYTREERNVLSTLAAQVAPALRVAQLVQAQQVQVREHARIEQELHTAQHIQQSLLPKEVPECTGWQFVPYYQSAREVGGDFYDVLPLEDGQLGIVIGDVTGKGVPAALVMATTCTMLRTAAQASASPGEVLARVNDLLCARIPPGMFVTCFYAMLDPTSGLLRYANAGHDWPFRQRDRGSSISELRATGMPLGMMPGTRYEEQEAILFPGETLLLYSDGLVEAHSPRYEMFGLPRLKFFIEEYRGEAPLISGLLDELNAFTGDDWEQEDDVTLLLVRRKALPIEAPGEEGNADGWRTLEASTIPSTPDNERQAVALVAEALHPLVLPNREKLSHARS